MSWSNFTYYSHLGLPATFQNKRHAALYKITTILNEFARDPNTKLGLWFSKIFFCLNAKFSNFRLEGRTKFFNKFLLSSLLKKNTFHDEEFVWNLSVRRKWIWFFPGCCHSVWVMLITLVLVVYIHNVFPSNTLLNVLFLECIGIHSEKCFVGNVMLHMWTNVCIYFESMKLVVVSDVI